MKIIIGIAIVILGIAVALEFFTAPLSFLVSFSTGIIGGSLVGIGIAEIYP